MKAVLVAALAGTAVLIEPWPRGWFVPGLLLFGLFNAIVSPSGTLGVRLMAIGATLAALWSRGGLAVLVGLLAWLVWPPAYAVAWALARERSLNPDADQEDAATAWRARIGVAALIGAVAVGVVTYRLIALQGLKQTAALFVGIPALVAITVVFAVSPRSATGVACKAVTIGLLVSLLFLGEGMVCVMMSAPLFYAIAVAIASGMEAVQRRRNKATTLFSCAFLVVLVPMSLEGVTPMMTVTRDASVTETRIVHASSQEIARAMFAAPRFDRRLPLYLRAGFPRGVATRIERRPGGAMRWLIEIRGGEMRLNGMEARSGVLALALEEARPGSVRWRAVSDTSHMTHFLTWQESVVVWEPVGADTTKVTWTLRYRRGLDPAWYFGPWERYAARLAAGYLIDAVATP
jgi:hypothetical protein